MIVTKVIATLAKPDPVSITEGGARGNITKLTAQTHRDDMMLAADAAASAQNCNGMFCMASLN